MSLCGSPDVSFPSSETVHTENVLAQSSPSQEGSLRQSKVTETPIVLIVKDADAGRPVNEIWRMASAPRRTTRGMPRMAGWRPPA